MNVGTISLVGISVVFFTFVVLFFLFKLLAKLFGDKKTVVIKKSVVSDNTVKTKKTPVTQQSDLELVAVITAAIASYTSKDFKILNIKEKEINHAVHWKNQKPKIWRPIRKGVKRTW
jgi:sodium pump decarboxylase gamma subunit